MELCCIIIGDTQQKHTVRPPPIIHLFIFVADSLVSAHFRVLPSVQIEAGLSHDGVLKLFYQQNANKKVQMHTKRCPEGCAVSGWVPQEEGEGTVKSLQCMTRL